MTVLRAIPASLLAATSAVLAGASKLAELGARRLAPPSSPPEPPVQPPAPMGDVTAHPTPFAPQADAPDVLDQGEVEQGLEAAQDVVDASLEVDVEVALDAVESDADADNGLEVAGDIVSQAADASREASLPPQPDSTGVVVDLPPTDASIVDNQGGQARTYESHIAELAERNASDVVRSIQDLSTEELGQLFDYESAHRKRKTVLQAIERAAAPTDEETVFSTESAAYRAGNPPL